MEASDWESELAILGSPEKLDVRVRYRIRVRVTGSLSNEIKTPLSDWRLEQCSSSREENGKRM